VNALFTVHNGFPFEVTATDNSNTRSGNARANCIAPAHVLGDLNSPLGGYQFWDPSSFTQPPVGTLGNCGTGVIRGPGMTEADLGLSKLCPAFIPAVRPVPIPPKIFASLPIPDNSYIVKDISL